MFAQEQSLTAKRTTFTQARMQHILVDAIASLESFYFFVNTFIAWNQLQNDNANFARMIWNGVE